MNIAFLTVSLWIVVGWQVLLSLSIMSTQEQLTVEQVVPRITSALQETVNSSQSG
jgi:hypothetical protein